jgi:uncharacterized delta-60 repeat protein
MRHLRGFVRTWPMLTLLVTQVSLSAPASASPGDLDTSFSRDGRVTTAPTRHGGGAEAVAVQADGKIVAAGSSDDKFAVARFNRHGSLDTNFGADGTITTNFTAGSDFASSIAVQADGKIVAAGQSGGANPKFALARYNTDGTLDAAFGGDGRVTTDFSKGSDGAYALVIQADGKIVAAGIGGCVFGLARYNGGGTLDSSFDSDGKVTTDFGTDARGHGCHWVDSVAIQANGRIVAGGNWVQCFGDRDCDHFSLLAGYIGNGTLDTTFGDGGTVFGLFPEFLAVALQQDGKIVGAGLGEGAFALSRYDADGTPDATFGRNGTVFTNFTRHHDAAYAVAVQANGKIVSAGVAGFGDSAKFALARYLGA